MNELLNRLANLEQRVKALESSSNDMTYHVLYWDTNRDVAYRSPGMRHESALSKAALALRAGHTNVRVKHKSEL